MLKKLKDNLAAVLAGKKAYPHVNVPPSPNFARKV